MSAYRHGRQSKTGKFSPEIKPEVAILIDIYCKQNNIDKTGYVNAVLAADMAEKFSRLKEENND